MAALLLGIAATISAQAADAAKPNILVI